MRVMARAVPSEDSWGEDENRKGGGPDWFKDYMVARDLEDQEEDGLGNEADGLKRPLKMFLILFVSSRYLHMVLNQNKHK